MFRKHCTSIGYFDPSKPPILVPKWSSPNALNSKHLPFYLEDVPCTPSLADKAPSTNTYHSQTVEASGPSHASTQVTEPSGGSQAQNAITYTYLSNPFSSKLQLVHPGC